jgi:predicted SAM-dependent methyltransferase
MDPIFSKRTQKLINFDLLRYDARMKIGRRKFSPNTDKLHLGCQEKKISGWLNVDVTGSDLNIDLGGGYLPFHDATFQFVVCQQTIEHLDVNEELIPLLFELHRVSRPGAELWFSCPDMRKLCTGYLKDGGKELLLGKQSRYAYTQGELPTQHVLNAHFYQDGEHQNVFDIDFLNWMFKKTGFKEVIEVTESLFLDSFSEFPIASDEDHSIYIKVLR